MTTIVVVDDETLITDFLAFFLEDAGYIVHVARNGVDGLDLIGRVVPDLVITDYMMPAMSGLELARALKANEALAHIPVILSSAALGASARAHPTLFAAILDKPYPAQKLLKTLVTLLDARDGAPGDE
ncbi:response regulator [Paraburkholderia sp. J67]|uniref:response regulator n=1 Tax=Paraburkholderia sp. J67 TaxID=2805435 RepID=UPI002ABD8EB0|nr:response regulator [Paraburkholderia sp. J67]